MRRRACLLAIVILLLTVQSAMARIVYMGTDPSLHQNQPEAPILVQNAVQWAGQGADPAIAYTACASLTGNVDAILATAGFTNRTLIPSGALAAADLSPFDVLYVGIFGGGSCAHADLVAAAANIQSFQSGGVG